ncbi:MAG: CvpA family protein [Dysgonamonadaceae bacterium]|jgi:membrane protein required for colicin V production|nr:CvpA family protein [Dysgonamonadaceae bacterium]
MNWFDISVLICLGIGLVKGLFDGFVKQLIALVALILAFVFSGTAADLIRNLMENTLHWTVHLNPSVINVLYYIVAFSIIVAVFTLLAVLVDKLVNITPAGVINKIAGGIFGVVLWILCLSFILNVFSVFDSESKIINKNIQEQSITYKPFKAALPTILPLIKKYLQ